MQPADCDPLSLLNPTRRHFLSQATMGVGAMALSRLLPDAPASMLASGQAAGPAPRAGVLGRPHFTPRARRIIYLSQSGGPSQLDLFDYKPLLNERNGQELPDEIRRGQRLTGMSSNQSTIPLAGAQFAFERHGRCGAWVSELLPYTSQIVDELGFGVVVECARGLLCARGRFGSPAAKPSLAPRARIGGVVGADGWVVGVVGGVPGETRGKLPKAEVSDRSASRGSVGRDDSAALRAAGERSR